MIRKIAMLVLFVAVSLSCEENHSPKVAKDKGNQQMPSALASPNDQASTPNANHTRDNAPNWYTSPEWWLVILGFPTLFFIGWQARETRRAAEAMQFGNRALIDAQRARLTIEISRLERKTPKREEVHFEAFAVNTSSTIAEVTGVWASVHRCGREIFKDFDNANILPEPDGGTLREAHRILARDKWCFKTVYAYELAPFEVRHRIEKGELFVAWYGWIEFRDFVGREHRQRFCFMYSERAKNLLAFGPAGHNAEEY